MTYNVFSGTLNPTRSTMIHFAFSTTHATCNDSHCDAHVTDDVTSQVSTPTGIVLSVPRCVIDPLTPLASVA